jgi:predicted RNA-binding Zn-ribbon protein involved in translation (DUF1610 family)
MSRKFTRRVEDFVCTHCGAEVKGTGYTNHCPRCLWSRHVDVNPGDRAAECGGMMEPVRVERESDTYVLTHRCTKCGFARRNKVGSADNFDAVLAIVDKQVYG